MTIWTNHNDVLARWVGGNEPTDHTQITRLINDAEAVVLNAYPRIQERIDDDLLSQDVVTIVTCRMVIRVLRNPENLTYHQQTTGPFGQARNFGTGNVDMWMTPEEKNLLAPNKRGKAFSFELAPDAVDGRRLNQATLPSTDTPVWIDED